MNELNNYINNHKSEFEINGEQSLDALSEIENIYNLKIGNQLKYYLLNYGSITYKSMELYGLGFNDDDYYLNIATRTKFLNESFGLPEGYFVVENMGDGAYIVVDINDDIFLFEYNKAPLKLNKKFEDYLIRRFTDIDNM
jgi:hypothetical protein